MHKLKDHGGTLKFVEFVDELCETIEHRNQTDIIILDVAKDFDRSTIVSYSINYITMEPVAE